MSGHKITGYLLPLVLAVAFAAMGIDPARGGEGLSIAEVVKMKESGWSDELIIKMVNAKGLAFDASIDNLNRLREAKLSDTVLAAVIEAGTEGPRPETPPAAAPVEVPAEPAPPVEVVPPVQPQPGDGPPPTPEIKECKTCGSTGLVRCPAHRSGDFLVSSEMKEPPACCGGTGWILCPACRSALGQTAIDERRRALAARREEWPRMDKAAGSALFHGETTHFCLDTDLPPREAAAAAAHCEALLTKLRGLFPKADFDFTRPESARLFCLGKVDTYVKFIEWFGPYIDLRPEHRMRLAQSDGMTIYSRSGHTLCVRERAGKDYMNFLVNGYGKILINYIEGREGQPPAWLTEGFATFCETLELGRPGVWSFSYDPKNLDIAADWKGAVRKAVQSGKAVSLEQLFGKSLAEFAALDYQESWSVTNTLIYGGPDKYLAFVRALKQRTDQTEALEKAYGLKLSEIEAFWKNAALNQR